MQLLTIAPVGAFRLRLDGVIRVGRKLHDLASISATIADLPGVEVERKQVRRIPDFLAKDVADHGGRQWRDACQLVLLAVLMQTAPRARFSFFRTSRPSGGPSQAAGQLSQPCGA